MSDLYPVSLLQGIPEKANILVLNVQYVKPRKLENGQWTPDYLYIVYRDNDTLKKKLQIITNPSSDIYTTKPEYMDDFKTQREAIPFDKVDKHHVLYRDKEKFLMKMLNENIRSDKDKLLKLSINTAMELGKYNARKEVHKWRHAYYSDYELPEYVQTSSYLHYDPKSFKITKSFLDIECDFYQAGRADIELGARPINAVTVSYDYDYKNILNTKYKPTFFTYLLRDHKRYKEQAELEANLDEFIKRVHREYDEKFGEAEYIIKFYDDESEMLYDIFKVHHLMKPDFCGIWNMSFDILYFQKRMTYLNLPAASFFCHPDFKNVWMEYKLDKRYENDAKNRNDSFNCLSYTKYYDQMYLYPARRKGRQDHGSNALDNIARIELKDRKAKFEKRGTNVINAAIFEYMRFVLYSIKDVWLQTAIERKVGDLDDIFMRSDETGVRYDKTNRMTASLKTLWDISHFEEGYVMGNNLNVNHIDNEELDTLSFDDIYEAKLKGAIVGNPTNLNNTGAVIFTSKDLKRSNRLFLDLIDLDFASLYPNIKMVNNISKSSQYGRLIIPDKVSPLEYGVTPQLRGGEFIDDYETHDWLKVGIKWFGLKRTETYINEFRNYISKSKNNKIIPMHHNNGEFFKLWSAKMKGILKMLFPDMNSRHFLYKVYRRDVVDTNCFVYNNYEDIEYPTTLINIVNWIIEEKPILTESGTFFKRPESISDISPGLRTLSKLGKKRAKIKELELQYEVAGDKENARLANLGQNRVKTYSNSEYGIGGAPTSFSYNYHIAQSVTSKGQTLISTAYTVFDEFLTDSMRFYDVDELLHYIHNIITEDIKYDDEKYIKSNKSVEEVIDRLLYKCTNIKVDTEMLYEILRNVPQALLNRLYYKSNLQKFITDNPSIQDMFYSFGVNTLEFLDPNSPSKDAKKSLSSMTDVIIEYCFYNHAWYGRIDRLIHTKRNVVITLDTDSNIITIHDILNTIKKYMGNRKSSNRIVPKDLSHNMINHPHFKGVNTCAFILTEVINRALVKFEDATNVTGHLLGVYKMKNEFYYLAMLINSGKKRYLGNIMLREGRYLPKGKRDVKGFDFIKISAATEEVNNYIQDVLFEHIVTDNIDVSKAITKLIHLEKKLRTSLQSGESTYLTPAKVSTMDSYKEPMKIGSFKATYIWNKLYPDQEIELPNTVNLIKLNISSQKDISKLALDDRDMFDKIVSLLNSGMIKEITQIAVPIDCEEIPKWILENANFDTMVDKTMNLIIPVLQEIGMIPVFKRKNEKQLSNLIEIG